MDIAAGLTAATAALTTVKQLAEIDKAISVADLKLKIASLYSDLSDVRMALSDAREALSDKDRQIADLKAVKTSRANYRMLEVSHGVMVYAFEGSDQPAHWACIRCLDRGVRSILQNRGNEDAQGRRGSYSTWQCNECRAELRIPYMRKPAADPGVVLD